MIVLKIWFHICSLLQMLFLKLIYGNKFFVGNSVTWRNNFSVMIAKTGKVIIGDNCFFNNGCSINANKLVCIGEGTLFGENVKIYDHNHRFRDSNKSIKQQGFSNGEVIIGEHCWIGSNVVVLKGTTIGNNCVIGAGCIISGKVEDNTVLRFSANYQRLKVSEK